MQKKCRSAVEDEVVSVIVVVAVASEAAREAEEVVFSSHMALPTLSTVCDSPTCTKVPIH